MSDTILPFQEWPEGIAQASVPANENSLRNEALRRPCLGVSNNVTSPADGDLYIVGDTPTGSFSTFTANDLAFARVSDAGESWYAWAPTNGLRVWMDDGSQMVYVGESTNDWQTVASGGISDGDKGDITVSGGGVTWTIDSGVVTYAKMQDVSATQRLLGRNTAGSGDPEEVTLTQLLDWVGSAANGDILYRSGGSWTRLPIGTNGQVLTVASSLPSWAAGGGGGLTGFTASLETASPNGSQNASLMLPSGGTGNQDGVYARKGSGAILGSLPDSTATGGSKRGSSAVDWQLSRSAASQVASGNSSAMLGCVNSTASGTGSVVIGGTGGTASATYALVLSGSSCTASASAAVTLGGDNNVASGSNSVAAGTRGDTRSIINAFALGCNTAKQVLSLPLFVQTTDATPTVLRGNASAASATNTFALPSNRAAVARVMVIARQSAGSGTVGDCAAWDTNVLVKNIAGTTSIVGTPSVTQAYGDAGASTWAITITANNTIDALEVTVTGEASKTIQWTAFVMGPES